jgi:hypothetical protein
MHDNRVLALIERMGDTDFEQQLGMIDKDVLPLIVVDDNNTNTKYPQQ